MGIMGFNSICYREYGWRWRIYASSKFSTSIRSMGSTLAWSITGLGVFMIALVFGNLAIRKPELKAGPQSYAQAMFPSKKLVKLQDIVWHGDIGLLTGNATASVIISFAGYLSTFFPVLQSKQILFQ